MSKLFLIGLRGNDMAIPKKSSLPALDFLQDLFPKKGNNHTANCPRNHLTSPAHQYRPQVPS